MTTLIQVVLAVTAALSCVIGSESAAGQIKASVDDNAKKEEKVRLVYCTQSLGFKHDVLPLSREVMSGLTKTEPWLEVTLLDDAAVLTAEKLKSIDVVMLYTTGMLKVDTAVLLDWVKGGGALVGVHSATDTLAEDPRYVELIGGSFDGHPWNESVTIIVDNPAEPITLPFIGGAKVPGAVATGSFVIADEIYQFKSLNPKNHVLMHLDPKSPKAEEGRAYPLAWTREVGKGRMFYTALGHRPEVWKDPRFVDHVKAGIAWAARRDAAEPAAPKRTERAPQADKAPEDRELTSTQDADARKAAQR